MALKRRVESKSQSALAARILAQREAGRAEVSLDRLEAEFADASRYEIVASLKELEKAGRGQLVVGRKGQRSHFLWAEGPDAPRGAKQAPKKAKASKAAGRGSSAAAPAPVAAGAAAPSLSAEPGPKGSARRVLVPAGRRPERPKLSSHASAVTRQAPGSPVPGSEPQPAAPTRTLRHTFHLRPGMLVSIELPEDVSATEVARFCSFLQAIPFEGAARG